MGLETGSIGDDSISLLSSRDAAYHHPLSVIPQIRPNDFKKNGVNFSMAN